jgi:hypothetical protein
LTLREEKEGERSANQKGGFLIARRHQAAKMEAAPTTAAVGQIPRRKCHEVGGARPVATAAVAVAVAATGAFR